MKYMGWGPRDLGFRAAMPAHIAAILELMAEDAAAHETI